MSEVSLILGGFVRKILKPLIITICSALAFLLLLFLTVLGYLTLDEYKPDDIEKIEVENYGSKILKLDKAIRIMTWNIGYGALGDNADFFMDGGKMVNTATAKRVRYNLDGIIDRIDEINPDILMIQEMDRNSARSHFIDEYEYIKKNSANNQSIFAYNYKVSFVPYPIPPIGKVEAGLATYSAFRIDDARRIQLPCPFSWPLRTGNLKRCLEVSRIQIENSEKELVLINLHLEAYDDGEGKIAQTNMLKELLNQELKKGNYVIAGGDFNQVFSNIDVSKYPVLEGNWEAGVIDVDSFDDALQFVTDTTNPTCRSLDKVYADAEDTDPDSFQYYVIDGFIVSDNIEILSLRTHNTVFQYSDHNPLSMDVVLLPET